MYSIHSSFETCQLFYFFHSQLNFIGKVIWCDNKSFTSLPPKTLQSTGVNGKVKKNRQTITEERRKMNNEKCTLHCSESLHTLAITNLWTNMIKSFYRNIV
jgi:hypothetical protein